MTISYDMKSKFFQTFLLYFCLGVINLSCQSTPDTPKSGDLLTDLYMIPPNGDWHAITHKNKRFYFNPNNAITDEDIIAITVEGMQLPQEINDIQDVGKLIGFEHNPDIVDTTTETIAGTPTLRWHLYKLEDIGTPENILEELKLRRRESREQYYRRAKGVIFKHPDRSRRGAIVRIGISRTSIHGFIGSHYEDIAVDFISRFLNANSPKELAKPIDQ